MLGDDLIRYYPRVFHMAHANAWPSIRKFGLLSTDRLVDIFCQEPEFGRRLLGSRRAESVVLSHPEHGNVVIRDQKPLVESKLVQLLDSTTVAEYLTLLNSQVFLWTSEERLQRLLNGRAYRSDPHLVLTLDTASLVATHEGSIRVTKINSGATVYVSGRRGKHTFQSIEAFRHPHPRPGSAPHAIVEVTVVGGVPDIVHHVLLAQRWQDGSPIDTVYKR